ncbi:M15 family metallopeptidase [Sphingobacterium lactis]|uniref:M15 family metallopeptidase n=1 Tax=Sphingobacterium lactis TaxID=797291 RepID=UPI003DA66784
MKRNLFLYPFIISLLLVSCGVQRQSIPDLFVDLKKAIPTLAIDLRYHGNHNFVGRPIRGYEANRIYLSKAAAIALASAQRELAAENLGFKVFDAYRPQQAVDHFKEWASAIADTVAKQEFYPDVDKRDLFKLGYIAEKSGHSRGSTIDLTLIDLRDGNELDMGSGFDYFGERSHHDYPGITAVQKANRKKLRQIMEKHGFKSIAEEWWHYTLINEPNTAVYYDFPIR